MTFQDKTLTCADCGQSFVFTAGEQEFHAQKGFSNTPKRCTDCRSKRKAQHSSGGPRRGGGGGGGGGFRDKPKFPAVCSRCGANFDAPFQPKEDRPVLCRECFSASKPAKTRGFRSHD